jgi:hypothetical protein
MKMNYKMKDKTNYKMKDKMNDKINTKTYIIILIFDSKQITHVLFIINIYLFNYI